MNELLMLNVEKEFAVIKLRVDNYGHMEVAILETVVSRAQSS